ncbi:MAG TPA: YggT family protein [Gemmatimonadaceae bacterium]|nr:YggT family protein [Gemmatimonadaceae bacterium]
MSSVLTAFDTLLGILRVVVFIIAAAALIIFTIDWLVRTRRISPFGGVARFFRRVVDPLIVPIEHRVVRAGGLPANAPWWALIAIVIGGLIVLALLEFIRGQIQFAAAAGGAGARGIVAVLVTWLFGILQVALIIRVISSWVRLSEWSKWIRWTIPLTEWLLRPLRRLIPPLAGTIDLSPLVAWLVLALLKGVVLSIL